MSQIIWDKSVQGDDKKCPKCGISLWDNEKNKPTGYFNETGQGTDGIAYCNRCHAPVGIIVSGLKRRKDHHGEKI